MKHMGHLFFLGNNSVMQKVLLSDEFFGGKLMFSTIKRIYDVRIELSA